MHQTDRSREQLLQEIAALRQRNRALEASQARYQQMEQALLASEARHRRLAAEQAMLAEIGRIISASLDISEVYEPLARAVRKLLAFDRMTISLADRQRQIITNVYVTGAPIPARPTGYTIPLAGTMTETVLYSPTGFFLHPSSESELRHRLPALLPFYHGGLRSFLAVRLMSRDQAIGALLMLSYQPDFFTDDALRLAISVSTQIASAIANAQSYLQQQQAEAALRESEARYRTLAEKSLQGITINRDGKRLFANPALARMLGYDSPDELVAADPWANVALHERERFNTYKQKRLQGQPAPTYYVYQGVKKDGSLVWLENTVSRIIWNGQPAMLKTLFDITERVQTEKRLKHMYAELERRVAARTSALQASNRRLQQEIAERTRSEAALRLSETRWRSLVENVPATITELDISGLILYTSRGWQGLSRDEVVGTHIDAYFPPDQRAILHHAMRQARQTRTMQQYEIALPSPAGTTTCYAYRLTVLAPYSVVSGFLLVSNDVTDQKMVEQVFRQQERLVSIGTLAAGIAHEINNPLGSIWLTAEHARQAYTLARHDVVLAGCLDDIIADIERCSRIVKGVLQFARQETSDKWPADLHQIVQTACDITRRYCHEHSVAMQVEAGDVLLSPVVNPVEIEQVLVNLIRNAVESRCDRITIRIGRVADEVRIDVHDNGSGIDAVHLPHIFDPFYTTSPERGGTGLGLSITHGIISDHGGSIDFTSQPGAGTTAHIRLPHAPSPTGRGPGGGSLDALKIKNSHLSAD